MPFCKRCGQFVAFNSNFCGACGFPIGAPGQAAPAPQPPPVVVAPPPPPPPPPPYYQQPAPQSQPAQPIYQSPEPPPSVAAATLSSQPSPAQLTSETVVGAIPLKKLKSLGSFDAWTAVVTNYRVIFAQVTNQMAKDAAQQARDQAKAEGKGFLGQWGDQLKSAFLFSQRYLMMQPNAALAETSGNFALDNSGIREVKLHLKEDHRGGGNGHYDREFSVEFKSAQGEYEFRMAENSQFTDLLKQVYGDRVKMPFGYFSKTVGSKGPVSIGFRIGR